MTSTRFLFIFLFLLTVLYGSIGLANTVSPVPAYPVSDAGFSLQLMGPPHHRPLNIRWDIDAQEITIRADISTVGFLAPPYEEQVEIGRLEPGTYRARYIGYFSGEPELLDQIVFTVAEPHPTIPAYSMFHPKMDHYLLTASERQRNRALDRGWLYADDDFIVWPASGPAPQSAEPVCHFYSSRVNSHVYTIDEGECDSLKASGGWQYRGIAFQALVPSGDMCPSGTTPVRRLYNNRHEQADGNHRYVTRTETYRTMMNAGWSGEGIAFCSPPALKDPGPDISRPLTGRHGAE